jgi:hypothetical protein
MYAIDNTLVSQDLLAREFVCDLSACKGACCKMGNAGAPLEDHEIEILEHMHDSIKPYLDGPGKRKLENDGVFEIDSDGDKGTALLEDGRCAYALESAEGVYSCAIEKANSDGALDFRKPVSCHLYPVRVTKFPSYHAVNYDKWDICTPACDCGARLKVPLFRFVKDGLIRKFGEAWYKELELIDELKRKEDEQN